MGAENESVEWDGLAELRPMLEGHLAARCRDRGELDDVVQETILRAARYRGGLAEGDRLRAWALRIASNVLVDHVRRERRLKRAPVAEEAIHEAAEPCEEAAGDELVCIERWQLARDDAIRHLDGAIGCLREEERRVLRSFYGEALSARETALACGIPRRLVKVRLYRARRRLRRLLRKRLALRLGGARERPA